MPKIEQFNVNEKIELAANKLLKQYPKVRKQKKIKIFNIIHKLSLDELDSVYKYLEQYVKSE